ncbi:hypothetical protein DES40_2488 [Litorimonas taeanensis]|uniref:Uncharacterized protein n=1 Tax=Litorimonas taeanensis TaxID=568099 RepID=A0A420WFB5_9PROT|nr:hypothetical protein [Litorimonas taeanensis]RKQ69684.1 hypothetical protein DES40_2488 [Litorimonas taeanensis]
MLWFLILFGMGLVAAAAYKARNDTKDRKDKLNRIQAEIARREALEHFKSKEG